VIVPWSSATRFCSEAALAVEANHIGIAKPESINSDAYIAVSIALKAHAFGPSGASPMGTVVDIHDIPISGIQELSNQDRVSKEQLGTILRTRGSLNLSNKTLILPARSTPSTYTLSADTLWLTNSVIVTNGNKLKIFANGMQANGAKIVSFTDQNRKAISESAASGGEVDMAVTDQLAGPLHVDLRGQDGMDGAPGTPGINGIQGSHGNNGADHLFDCAHGGEGGGNGTNASPGGDGKAGSPGGDGGTLVIDPMSVNLSNHLYFNAQGGKGGRGGLAGAGGKGGAAGPGGGGTTYCHGGPSGAAGADGASGNPGANGSDGREQTQVGRASI
jgi:hypothetical protein